MGKRAHSLTPPPQLRADSTKKVKKNDVPQSRQLYDPRVLDGDITIPSSDEESDVGGPVSGKPKVKGKDKAEPKRKAGRKPKTTATFQMPAKPEMIDRPKGAPVPDLLEHLRAKPLLERTVLESFDLGNGVSVYAFVQGGRKSYCIKTRPAGASEADGDLFDETVILAEGQFKALADIAVKLVG